MVICSTAGQYVRVVFAHASCQPVCHGDELAELKWINGLRVGADFCVRNAAIGCDVQGLVP